MTVTEILKEAIELSPVERAKLIDYLYNTFEDTNEKEYLEECVKEAEDRLDAYDRGEIKAEDYSVFAQKTG
jgi:hypothetical protein